MLLVCCGGCGLDDGFIEYPTAGATSPILLLHGFGGSGQTWHDAGVVRYLTGQGLSYGGDLTVDPTTARVMRAQEGPSAGTDVFTVTISDPFQDLDAWARELDRIVSYTRDLTGAKQVMILASSAGGVASRAYLVSAGSDHGVRRLVTLGSPHSGTEIALLADVAREIFSAADDLAGGGNGMVRLRHQIESATGVPLDAPILRQMMPVKHNPWLDSLNRTLHPADVEYVSVLAEAEPVSRFLGRLGNEVRQLQEDPTNSVLLARIFGGVLAALNDNGWSVSDGLVLRERQRMDNLPAFENARIEVGVVVVMARTHQDAKRSHRALLRALDVTPHLERVNTKA